MVVVYDKSHLTGAQPGNRDGQGAARGSYILAVGEVGHWRSSGRDLPFDSQIVFADFHDVTAELIASLEPEFILSPLVSGTFDCLDLAQVLHEIGFLGRFRILVPHLPNPRIITAEIKSLCPQLDLMLISSDDENPARLN